VGVLSLVRYFALMFHAARVAVIDFGLLILNLVCGYALDYPCFFC
jgi:hypothetical protein